MNNLSSRQCPFCLTVFHENNAGGQAWFGDEICDACAFTFEQCVRCGYYVQPHQVKEGDCKGDAICPECLPKYGDEDRCDRCELVVSKPEDWHSHVADTGRTLRFCGRCTAARSYVYTGNRTKVRKHPANIGHEVLDQEAKDAMDRSP